MWSSAERGIMKRVLAAIVGAIAILAGGVALLYARMAIDDFHNPRIAFREALVDNFIVWAVTVLAFVFGIRFLRFAIVGCKHGRTTTK
jgi:hypothetical protein